MDGDDKMKRPPAWRMAVPYLIAGAILYWVFRDIDFREFLDALWKGNLALVVTAMAGFTLVYSVCDITSYGLCYRWYVLPWIKVREMMNARLGSYLLHVLYTPLSTVANLVYLRRHKGAPVWWALSANALTSVHDLFSINVLLTLALVLHVTVAPVKELSDLWLLPVSVPWLVALGYALYWFTPVRDMKIFRKVTTNPILRSCRFAKAHHYLVLLGSRLAVAFAGVAANAALLYSFGIDAPLPMIIITGPLMIGTAFMPISGGGFGGPQLVAQVLLPYAGGNEALVAAYSVAFSAGFTLGRSLVGIIFMPSYLKDIRTSGPLISVDPLTGEALN